MKISKYIIGAVLIAAVAGFFIWSQTREQASDSGESRAMMPTYRAAGVEVGIVTDPQVPKVGDNRLIVELRTPDGEPVNPGDIEAYAEMPAMGAMAAMRAPAGLEQTGPGRFEGTLDLPMRGEWPLTLTFSGSSGQPARLQFDLATDRGDMPISSGGEAVDGGSDAAAGDDGLPRYRAGNYEIAVGIEPETARVGENRLLLEVMDADGKPVDDMEIDAFAQMPAMGAMPAMRAPAGLERTGPGRYEGTVDLSMRGEWPLTIQLGDRRVQFDLATDRKGLTVATGATPVGAAAAPAAEGPVVTIDNRRRQMIGVTTGLATHRDLVKSIRAVGEVTVDETRLSEVALKYDGYIGDLKADYVGMPVEQGQVLFTVYSPELLAAQDEYLEVRRRRSAATGGDSLLRAARQRLRLWDMSEAEIAALERRGSPLEYVPIHAPQSGTLIERHIADGSAAKKLQPLLSIADLSRVWVEAEVFEGDLELLQEGMQADVLLPNLPGRRYPARVEYVYPTLDGRTRTGRVRLSLDNSGGELKPAMYAEVSLQANLGHRLSVPEESIIFAGKSRVVFVDLGGGRLQPRRIRTGRQAGEFVEVLDGLALNDTVVTSGNFLIAAETRLKAGIDQW